MHIHDCSATQALHKLYKLAEAPEYICCPISQDVIDEPVLLIETGHVFERAVIQDWLRDHMTCPLTGVELSSKNLAPVHVFRSMAMDFKHKFVKKSIPLVVELLKYDLTRDQLLQIKDMLILANEYSNAQNENILVILLRVLALLQDYEGLCIFMTQQMDKLHARCDRRQIVNTISVTLRHFGPAISSNIDNITSALASSPHRVEHLICFKDALLMENLSREASKVCRYLSPMLHFVDKRAEGLKCIIEAIQLNPENDEFYETLLKSLKDRETLAEFCKLAIDESISKTEEKIVTNKILEILNKNEKYLKDYDKIHMTPIRSSIASFDEKHHKKALMTNEYHSYSRSLIMNRLSSNISLDKLPIMNRCDDDTVKTEHQIWCVVSLDEKTIATSHQRGGFIRIWDMQKMQHRSIGKGVEGMEHVWEIASSGPNHLICASRSFPGFHVFNWRTGQHLNTIRHSSSINSAGHTSFIVFGKYLLAALKNGTIAAWDFTKQGGELIRTYSGHKNYVNCIEALPNGLFATGSVDASIKIWSIDHDECIQSIDKAHDCGVTSLCLLNESTLVSGGGSEDKKVKLWDLSTLKCTMVMKGHDLVIKQITRIGPNTIATGSWDKTVRVWNTLTGDCVRVLEGHTDQVLGVIVHKDKLISVSKDRSMRIWAYQDDRSHQ
jgi:WD40 repeat protein